MISIRLKIGIFSSIIFLFLSCEAERIIPLKPAPEIEENIPPDNVIPDETNTNQDVSEIGNGSGQVVIKDTENKTYVIKPGTYWNITIENVKDVSIKGLNKVKISNGDMHIRNVNQLAISGISFEDWGQNAISIFDNADNLTLKDLKFRNINNSVISFKKNKRYDGTPESYSENIQLINIYAENIGTLFGSAGGLKSDGFFGLIKGFKLTESTIINSPTLSNGIYLNLAEDYEISNNIIKNVNSRNNDHNGIFHVIGNGKIFGNKITDHQGNGVRAWLLSIVKPNAVVEIYNNIIYNSTRYGAFELQVTPWMYDMSLFKPANAKIYNNTAGKLNTGEPKYFEGRLLDLYNISGTLEIFNNLSFNNRDDQLINNMSDTKIIRNENNQYFKNENEAIFDLTNFKSRIAGVGAN